jgi:Ca2+/Na+ antiporter
MKNKNQLVSFINFFMQPDIKKDLILQKLFLILVLTIMFYLPVIDRVSFLEVLPFMLSVFVWYMLTYSIALYLKPESDSYHRWQLFFANFLLLPIPVILGMELSKKLKNIFAQTIAFLLSVIVIWWALSNFFTYIIVKISEL